ncbi:MAG: AAA family ATPase [Candidatus Hydrothermarchaeales archaeon]
MCEILDEGEYFKVKEPELAWDRIGGFQEVKERLEEMVSMPIKFADSFERAGTKPHSGILMWGPPKTSMNSLVEAAAKSAGSTYISASSKELIKEPREITHLYEKAAEKAPCIIYIDEIDLLAPRREIESTVKGGNSRKQIAPPGTTRLLFKELDKVSDIRDVITVGGTYSPEGIDPAVLRNGRLERKIYVPMPDFEDRLEILKLGLEKIPLADDISLEKLAELTRYYVANEIASLPREAVLLAIKEKGDDFDVVEMKHFERAMKRVPPSLSPEIIKRYEETLREECKHRYMY